MVKFIVVFGIYNSIVKYIVRRMFFYNAWFDACYCRILPNQGSKKLHFDNKI